MKLEHLSPDDLVPFDRNPRRNDHAVDAVARSIEAFGFNCPIVAGPDNRICAGHTRWKAAKKLGLKTVPVVKVDALAAEKFVAFNLADNQTGRLAEWQDDLLAELVAALSSESANLESMGFSREELDEILGAKETAAKERIEELTLSRPPAMTWVLIGLPTVRYHEIYDDIVRIGEINGIFCEATVGSENEELRIEAKDG